MPRLMTMWLTHENNLSVYVCACVRACACMCTSHLIFFLSFFVCYWGGIHFYGCPHFFFFLFWGWGGGGGGGSGAKEGILNSLFPKKQFNQYTHTETHWRLFLSKFANIAVFAWILSIFFSKGKKDGEKKKKGKKNEKKEPSIQSLTCPPTC